MFKAMWTKQDGTRVKVNVEAFSTASIGDGPGFRPVAIISDPTNNFELRYVELKFLQKDE